MGYTNDITISTTREGLEVIYKALKEIDAVWFLEDADVGIVGEGRTISWKGIKFGDYYSEDRVSRVIQNALEDIDLQNIPAQFIRIGEELGDIEIRDYGSDDFLPCRLSVNTVITTWTNDWTSIEPSPTRLDMALLPFENKDKQSTSSLHSELKAASALQQKTGNGPVLVSDEQTIK